MRIKLCWFGIHKYLLQIIPLRNKYAPPTLRRVYCAKEIAAIREEPEYMKHITFKPNPAMEKKSGMAG